MQPRFNSLNKYIDSLVKLIKYCTSLPRGIKRLFIPNIDHPISLVHTTHIVQLIETQCKEANPYRWTSCDQVVTHTTPCRRRHHQ